MYTWALGSGAGIHGISISVRDSIALCTIFTSLLLIFFLLFNVVGITWNSIYPANHKYTHFSISTRSDLELTSVAPTDVMTMDWPGLARIIQPPQNLG